MVEYLKESNFIDNLVICIPVHGYSKSLENSLQSIDLYIRRKCREKGITCTLLLANSGSELSIEPFWHGDYHIIDVSSRCYWSGGVKALFIEAKKYSPTHILLMNHDILLLSESFSELMKYAEKSPDSVLSSVSVIGKPYQIENAGFCYTNGTLPLKTPYVEEQCHVLPEYPYPVDLLNGRCVLFPALAANPKFLCPFFVPHYFADAVLSAKARRNGFSLLVVPESKIFSDQSDTEFKRLRQRCSNFMGTYNCLFKPYSYRYLWGGFWGQILLSDNLVLGFVLSCKYTVGRLFKSLLELLGIVDPL